MVVQRVMTWWLTWRLWGTDYCSSGLMQGCHMRSCHHIGKWGEGRGGKGGWEQGGGVSVDLPSVCMLCDAVLCVCSVRYAVTLWFFDTEERKLAEATQQDAP